MTLHFNRLLPALCLSGVLLVSPGGNVHAADNAPPPPSAAAIENDPAALVAAANEAAQNAQEAQNAEMMKMRQGVFEGVMGTMMPLSNDQIRTYMQRLESTQEASVPPSGGQPAGMVKFETVSLDPGAKPSQINLTAGYITTLTFVDASGQPWPIADVGVAGNFEAKPTTSGSHVVRIIPLVQKGVGNLSILLKELPTPIIFSLAAGGPNMHWRFDTRVPKYGPNAKLPLIDRRRLIAGDEMIMMFLDNAPPPGAKRLKVSGLDAGRTTAWQMDDKVYVRTQLTMLSPSWDSSISSSDGTTVYQVGNAPVLLMSDAGTMVRARLMRDADDDK